LIFVFILIESLGTAVSHRTTSLATLELGDVATIEHVGGERAFRRRIMELGLVPGTRFELVAVAPLGDPLEFLVRGASLSIRRADAAEVRVAQGLEAIEDSVESGESASTLSRALVRGTP
jgi:Fe2+ transport system protein FeoA